MNENNEAKSNGMPFLGMTLTIFGLMVLGYGMMGGKRYLGPSIGSTAISGAILINPMIFIVLILVGLLMIYDHLKEGK